MTRSPLVAILLAAIMAAAGHGWALEVGEAGHLLGRTNFAAKPAEVAALLPLDRAAARWWKLPPAPSTLKSLTPLDLLKA